MASVQKQLNDYGLRVKKSLGQNFLRDPSVCRDIADSIRHEKPLVVVEVGPGLGALTKELSRIAEKVIAFEVDTSLRQPLEKLCQEHPNCEIRWGDFLKTDLDQQISIDPDHDLAFASNLPYYITTPVLFKVLESGLPFISYTVMMQKEVADRFLAQQDSPDYNDLSVIAHYLCSIRKVRSVSRSAFVPQPKVDSTVIQFIRRPYPHPVKDQQQFFDMVQGLFRQRRKTILNNYAVYLADKQQALQLLQQAGIAPDCRAQQLSIDQFVHLYEVSHHENESIRED